MEISDPAVMEVFEREGYLKEDGRRDVPKVAARITDIVVARKVLNRKERDTKAITRGDLVTELFPSLIGKDEWESVSTADRPQIEAVYRTINKFVWSLTSMTSTGPVQAKVALVAGNGYVLCRTKLGKDATDAVYITDNVDCIKVDFTRPANESLEKKIQKVTQDRVMLAERQPANGKVYASELDRMLKTSLAASNDQMKLAIESGVSEATDAKPADEAESA